MSGFAPAHNLTSNAQARGERTPEHLLSQLLMGFVERNVSPHTICDIVRSQVMDARLGPQVLSAPTCSGVIEVLTSSAGVTGSADVILYLATQSGFPQFLSGRALTGIVVFFLKQLGSSTSRHDPQRQHRMTSTVDTVARRIVAEAATNTVNSTEKMRILNAIKALPEEIRTWLSGTAPSLEALRHTCSNDTHPLTQRSPVPALAAPSEMLTQILESGEHLLAQKGVSYYRTSPVATSLDWRRDNVETIVEILSTTGHSDFRKGFLTEWYFDGMLRETLHNETFLSTLQRLSRLFVERLPQCEAIQKGLLRALQRDLSFTATELNYPESQSPQFQQLLQRSQFFFTLIFPLATANPHHFSKTFAQWALQMPVHPAESRLFTRAAWQWMRIQISEQWEDDLREPPAWITTQASRFTATIFRMAPSFWLQDHGHLLVERLHLESLQTGFTPSAQHADYIEFLVRTLRKKSPFFASRSELIFVLKILGRANTQEENQLRILETRLRMNAALDRSNDPERQFWNSIFGDNGAERFGANTATRALHVLVHTLRVAARGRKAG